MYNVNLGVPAGMVSNCYFQNLMYGFTSGNLCAGGVQQVMDLQRPLLPIEESTEFETSSCSSDNESLDNNVDDGYMESGEDESDNDEKNNDNEESENEKVELAGETETSIDGTVTLPSEEDMKLIDWDQFYTTGELFKVTDSGQPSQSTDGKLSVQENARTNYTTEVGLNQHSYKKRYRFT